MRRVQLALVERTVAWAFTLLLAGCSATSLASVPSVSTQVVPNATSPSLSPPVLVEPIRLTPDQVRARQATGESIVVVDVRSAAEFAAGHIAGALSVPWPDLPRHYSELPKDKYILLYCT
jgi:3-mercaptopyruvate sulfurtransferase SseA